MFELIAFRKIPLLAKEDITKAIVGDGEDSNSIYKFWGQKCFILHSFIPEGFISLIPYSRVLATIKQTLNERQERTNDMTQGGELQRADVGLGLVLLITWEMTVYSDLASSTSALSLACASALLLCGPKARGSFHFPSLLGEISGFTSGHWDALTLLINFAKCRWKSSNGEGWTQTVSAQWDGRLCPLKSWSW